MNSVDVNFFSCHSGRDIAPPQYATQLSAGADLSAMLEGEVVLDPGCRKLIPTGLGIALPPGFEAQIRSRSGLAWKHGVSVLNSPGTIDADYRGEIKVILINHSDESFTVTHGMRIAQIVIAPVVSVAWQKVVREESEPHRGGGFGSTGLKAF